MSVPDREADENSHNRMIARRVIFRRNALFKVKPVKMNGVIQFTGEFGKFFSVVQGLDFIPVVVD